MSHIQLPMELPGQAAPHGSLQTQCSAPRRISRILHQAPSPRVPHAGRAKRRAALFRSRGHEILLATAAMGRGRGGGGGRNSPTESQAQGRGGGAGLHEVPPTPWFKAALIPALEAIPALGVSLLFLAPDTKPSYFGRAASEPNTSRLSNAEIQSPRPSLIGGVFTPNLLALDPQSALAQPTVWGCRSTPFLPIEGKRKHLPAPWRLKPVHYPSNPGLEGLGNAAGHPPSAAGLTHPHLGGSRIPSCASTAAAGPSLARVGAADSSSPPLRRRGIHRAASRGCIADPDTQQTKGTRRRLQLPGTKSWSSSEPPPSILGSPKMLDTISSQYDSFIYWRMPIPQLDVAELEGLGLSDIALYKPKGGLGKLVGEQDEARQDISQEEDGLLQFNSFNFWRAPIASISSLDFDLI